MAAASGRNVSLGMGSRRVHAAETAENAISRRRRRRRRLVHDATRRGRQWWRRQRILTTTTEDCDDDDDDDDKNDRRTASARSERTRHWASRQRARRGRRRRVRDRALSVGTIRSQRFRRTGTRARETDWRRFPAVPERASGPDREGWWRRGGRATYRTLLLKLAAGLEGETRFSRARNGYRTCTTLRFRRQRERKTLISTVSPVGWAFSYRHSF